MLHDTSRKSAFWENEKIISEARKDDAARAVAYQLFKRTQKSGMKYSLGAACVFGFGGGDAA